MSAVTHKTIERLLARTERRSRFFRSVLKDLDDAAVALRELERHRLAARAGRQALNFDELLDKIRQTNDLLACQLAEARLGTFLQGKLILLAEGQNYVFISFHRAAIEAALQQLYPGDWQVRIRHVDQAGEKAR